MERERHMGTEASRWLHSAMLSPVQMAAMRCVPANADLDEEIIINNVKIRVVDGYAVDHNPEVDFLGENDRLTGYNRSLL